MPKAFVLLNVDLGKEDQVLNALRNIPGVIEAHRVYGTYDTIVKVETDSNEKLKEVITWRIRRMDGVRSTLNMIVVE